MRLAGGCLLSHASPPIALTGPGQTLDQVRVAPPHTPRSWGDVPLSPTRYARLSTTRMARINFFMARIQRWALSGFMVAASAALVAACGGGGGGTSAPPPAPAGNTSTINGIGVPPEPEATSNAATLAGIDTNANGVRDDVERSIAQNTPQTFADAMKVAKVLQQQVAGTTATTPAEQAEAFCLAAVMPFQVFRFTVSRSKATRCEVSTIWPMTS